MELTGEARGDTTCLTVGADRIDASSAIQFKDRFRDAVADGGARVVLDMERVEFLDSSGLGAVVAAMKLLGPGRKLELTGLTPTVEKVFRLTRMDSVFTIHPDVATALGDAAPTLGPNGEDPANA